MRFIDCHCHMGTRMVKADELLRRMDEARVDAVSLMSFAPERQADAKTADCPRTPEEKLRLLREFGAHSDRIYTMFWIDPLAEDAFEQVDRAAEAGVTGFKVICEGFYPCDERPMEVFRRIAETGKPLHFHSGILYSIKASSKYNRPLWFEDLLQIPHLRFALAHVSWPWVDECLAVYGHWNYMKSKGTTTSEMFIDTTPGTPPLYREEAIRKIWQVGYDVENNVMLGIDNEWDYSVDYSCQIRTGDEYIMRKLGLSGEVQEKYLARNYLRFIGVDK